MSETYYRPRCYSRSHVCPNALSQTQLKQFSPPHVCNFFVVGCVLRGQFPVRPFLDDTQPRSLSSSSSPSPRRLSRCTVPPKDDRSSDWPLKTSTLSSVKTTSANCIPPYKLPSSPSVPRINPLSSCGGNNRCGFRGRLTSTRQAYSCPSPRREEQGRRRSRLAPPPPPPPPRGGEPAEEAVMKRSRSGL